MKPFLSPGRIIMAIACSLALSGCAVINPYSTYAEGPRSQAASAPTDMVKAQTFALDQIKEYRSALSQRAWLRNVTPLVVLPLSGWLMYRGAAGADATNLLLGGLAGATAYGLSSFYTSSPIEGTYLAGITAINCAMTIASPYAIGTDELTRLEDARKAVLAALVRTRAELGDGQNRSKAERQQAEEGVAKAESVVRRAQTFEAQRQAAASKLTAAVDSITVQVDENIRKQTPDLASVLALASGLSGLAGQIAPLPRQAGSSAAALGPEAAHAGDGAASAPKTKPFNTLADLQDKTNALDDLVRVREAAVAQNNAPKECNVGTVASDFSVSPPNDEIAIEPRTSIQFVVRGGTGIPRASVIGLVGPVVLTNTAQGNTLLVTANYGEPVAGIDQAVIEFSDGAQLPSRKRVTLRLGTGVKQDGGAAPAAAAALACKPLTLLGPDLKAARDKLGLAASAELNAKDADANAKVEACRKKLALSATEPPGCFDGLLWEKLKQEQKPC